jgi:nucleoside diphosphate kinase
MQSLHKGIIKQSYKQPLNDLLTLSDFVKFAKAQPDFRDNENAIQSVRQFIGQTKPKEEVDNKINPSDQK